MRQVRVVGWIVAAAAGALIAGVINPEDTGSREDRPAATAEAPDQRLEVMVPKTRTAITPSTAPVCESRHWEESRLNEPGYEAGWDQLVVSGWYGDPNDGEERIYSPECRGPVAD